MTNHSSPESAAMDDMRDPEVASAMRAEEALNDLRAERAEATGYAERLAFALWEKHFREDAPDWKPLHGDLLGILTQIDNMTTGLSRAPAQTPLDPEEIRKANHAIARWLSAALEDPAVCEAMKSDINRWFEAHEPWPSPLTSTDSGGSDV